jgi:hypothetical protein
VLLAVSWRLFDAWVQEVPPPPKDPDQVLAELEALNVSNINNQSKIEAGKPALIIRKLIKIIHSSPAIPLSHEMQSAYSSHQFNY